ncbi:MAG: CHASE2 domain-containing protein [Verrucomicrobia bacterium]|nr:CHASE2 domain-containing protein [Verrucomicrobiota bacterium]
MRSELWERLKPAELRSHLKSAVLVIGFCTAVTFVFTQLGWFSGLESSSLDFFLKTGEPVPSKYVWLIAITDDDYDHLFHEKSPLDADTLAKIIQIAAEGQPAVIGVDIDTTKSTIVFDRKVMASSAHWPPIIWAQNAVQRDGVLEPQPVLGGAQPQPPAALAFFPIDENDRVVRRYRRMLPTVDGEERSMPWALVKTFCTVPSGTGHPAVCRRIDDPDSEHQESPLILTFSAGHHPNTRRIEATELLAQENSDGWKENSPIKGQIVIVGGVFSKSADWYTTPFGPLPGAELIAQAVEAELQERTIKPAAETFMLAVDVVCGFLLVIWQFYRPHRLHFALRMLAVPVLAVLASYLVFFSHAHWINFVPVLAGVVIHEVYENRHKHKPDDKVIAGPAITKE